MAVISFYSSQRKETGQTLSLAALTTQMSIEHNYRILIISTQFNDLTLENCFWEYDKIRSSGLVTNGTGMGLDSGIEGLIKILSSNKSSTEIVGNYAKTILKERLDILMSPTAKTYDEYKAVAQYYSDIITLANRYYDFVFVDIAKSLPKDVVEAILRISDIVVMNLVQKLKTLNDFMELQSQNEFYKRKNIFLLVGRYERNSKYNIKNITRYLKEKKEVAVVPYNMLFLESCSEGTIIDYILKIRNIQDEFDYNKYFYEQVKNTSEKIVERLQEIQMKL